MEREIEIEDLSISTFDVIRGGFAIPDLSGVKIVHKPTGIEVESKSEKSAHANRRKCMELLREKLKSKNENLNKPEYHDEPGSLGRLSEHWPSVEYSEERNKFARVMFPHGDTVILDVEYTYPHKKQPDGTWYDYSRARIRCRTQEQIDELLKIGD